MNLTILSFISVLVFVNLGLIFFTYFKFLRFQAQRQGYIYSISFLLSLIIFNVFSISIFINSSKKNIDNITSNNSTMSYDEKLNKTNSTASYLYQSNNCEKDAFQSKLNLISKKDISKSDKNAETNEVLSCLSNSNLTILVVEVITVGNGDNSWEMKGKPMKLPFKDYISLIKSLEFEDTIEIDNIQYDNSGKINYIELSEKRKL